MEKLWFFERQLPPGVSLHPPALVRLVGALNLPSLRGALLLLAVRHESLRTRTPVHRGEPVQWVDPPRPVTVGLVDLTGLPPSLRSRALVDVAHAQARHPYDLDRGPLNRMVVARLGDDDHVLLLGLHHLITDLWSHSVLASDLSRLHATTAKGVPSDLHPAGLQYVDYSLRHREELSGDRLDRELSFWTARLRGFTELPLPLDRPRPARSHLDRARRWWTMPSEVADRVRALGRSEEATTFMTLLAAFQVLLATWCDTDDVLVIAPMSGRTRPDVELVTGFLVRDVWIRGAVPRKATMRELIRAARHESLLLLDRGDVPYEQLVVRADPGHRLDPHPLLQVRFAVHTVAGGGPQIQGVRTEAVDIPPPDTYLSPTDIEMQVYDPGDGQMLWNLVYDPAIHDIGTVENLGARFERLVLAACCGPDHPIGELDGAHGEVAPPGPDEPDTVAVTSVVASAARAHPDRIALRSGRVQVSYARLAAALGRLPDASPAAAVDVVRQLASMAPHPEEVVARFDPDGGGRTSAVPWRALAHLLRALDDVVPSAPTIRVPDPGSGDPRVTAVLLLALTRGVTAVVEQSMPVTDLPIEDLTRDPAGASAPVPRLTWTPDSGVCTALHSVPTPGSAVPFGTPVGVEPLVLDREGRPSPSGVYGRLHHRGAGLAVSRGSARGTAETFFPDPAGGGGRVVAVPRTVRRRPDGSWERGPAAGVEVVCGGHVVDLRAMEDVVRRGAPGVAEVGLRQELHDADGGVVLGHRTVAYVVPEPGHERAVTTQSVRRAVAGAFPAAAVPERVALVDSLPRRSDGELDREALLTLTPRCQAEDEPDPPRTPAERLVAEVWSGLLGVQEIRRDDDFFRLGGTSLLAVAAVEQLAAAQGRTGRSRLDLRTFLEEPVLADVANTLAAP